MANLINNAFSSSNEVVGCFRHLYNKFGFKRLKKIRSHSIQEIIANEGTEIKVDIRIKTSIKLEHDRPNIFVYDKKRNYMSYCDLNHKSRFVNNS